MRKFGVALVHHPVKNREGQVIATALTNLDLHDIARSALTFGAQRFFVVHPVTAQRDLVTRLVSHWTVGPGGRRVEDRSRAMDLVEAVPDVESARRSLDAHQRAELWVTSAEPRPGQLDQAEARVRLSQAGPPVLLTLGTGWGLAEELLEQADVQVAPIVGRGPQGYNHLSVRAAAAILLDRLTSEHRPSGGPR